MDTIEVYVGKLRLVYICGFFNFYITPWLKDCIVI